MLVIECAALGRARDLFDLARAVATRSLLHVGALEAMLSLEIATAHAMVDRMPPAFVVVSVGRASCHFLDGATRVWSWKLALLLSIAGELHVQSLVFSTLGGAHSTFVGGCLWAVLDSCLAADCCWLTSCDFAACRLGRYGIAKAYARRQYAVALEMDNRPLAARCAVYLTYGLYSEGRFREARAILDREQRYADRVDDHIVRSDLIFLGCGCVRVCVCARARAKGSVR